jgi:hypothetical protein
VIRRWREWRLHRARLDLADLEHHRRVWGWSYIPSESARKDTEIARAAARVKRLEALLPEGEGT